MKNYLLVGLLVPSMLIGIIVALSRRGYLMGKLIAGHWTIK